MSDAHEQQHPESETEHSGGTATAVAEHGADEPADHFTPPDVDQFTDDDTVAGEVIGKMLSLFFLYTVIAMSISAYWTYCAIAGD